METVGLHQAKTRLPRLLERVRRGGGMANEDMPGIRIHRGGVAAPCRLLPPEAFPDTRPDPVERERVDGIPLHETGANSRSVRARLASICAGWPTPPDVQEFYAAVRAPRPTVRQCAIVRAWAREATSGDIVRGWLEEAYTWPILAAALHRTEARHNRLSELLNGFAKAEWASAASVAWTNAMEQGRWKH